MHYMRGSVIVFHSFERGLGHFWKLRNRATAACSSPPVWRNGDDRTADGLISLAITRKACDSNRYVCSASLQAKPLSPGAEIQSTESSAGGGLETPGMWFELWKISLRRRISR
jgi:hypothetical protein